MKNIYVIFIIVLAVFSANAQNINLSGEKVLERDTILNRLFSDYKIYLLSFPESKTKDTFELNLNLGDDYSWKIKLFKNNMRSEGFESYLTTKEGKVPESYQIKTFKGFLSGNPKNSVRLSFFNNTVEGFIKINENEMYYIVPTERISGAKYRDGTVIIVKGEDFKEELYPANDAIISEWEEPSVTKSINYSNPVRISRIAVEGDYEFYQNHSITPISDIESIINMAEDVYQSTFNIIFRIVYINVYTTSNDPFTEEFT